MANTPTPILEEIKIQLEGAVFLFDAEADEEHPDPQGDAIELVREASSNMAEAQAGHDRLMGALTTLVNLHDGITDGGAGITPADWQKARDVLGLA